MANKDAAFGLKPSRMMGGAPYSGASHAIASHRIRPARFFRVICLNS